MPRQTYPRPNHQHAMTASKILVRHASSTRQQVDLPIPIEMIVEQTYGLEILWDEIEEPIGTTILGGLAPREQRIVLNSKHVAMFDQYIGPERFTLAHEFAHWIYDADNPNQLSLDIDLEGLQPYCYATESSGLSEDHRIREMNANKLAAHLLLPENLVRRVENREILRDLSSAARAWGVSITTLRIRLQDLGILFEQDTTQFGFM